MSDAQVDFFEDDAHLIGGQAKLFVAFPGAEQDEIFDLVVGEFALVEDSVVKFGDAADRHFETNRGLYARSRGLAVAASAARDAAGFGFAAFLCVIAAGVFFCGAVE